MSSSSTSPCSSGGSPYANSFKGMKENQRREEINGKIEELKAIVQDPMTGENRMSQEDVLFAAALQLTGAPCSSPSPGPMRGGDRKERKKLAEQVRRGKQKTAYEALKNHIMRTRLGSELQRSKLEKTVILDIVIEELSKKSRVIYSLPQNLPTPPLPLQFPPLYIQNLLMAQLYLNSLLNTFQLQTENNDDTESPKETVEPEKTEEPEEILDVVN